MNLLSESSRYAALALLALPLLLMLADYFLRQIICRIKTKADTRLAPAELAFLAREGDITHTMVVLGFDLFHRALKRPDGETEVLLPYEQRLWQKTKEFLKDKARDQVDRLTPLPKSSNPLEIVVKLSGSYKFLMGQVRQVVRQILNDPRQLRAYFSPTALGRFVTDIISAGYKDMISSEIIATLTARGYLLSKKRQDELSSWLLIIASIGFAALINIVWWLVPDVWGFLLVLTMALINAVTFKLTFSIFTILPLYEEVNLVLKHVSVKNYAVRLCRILSRILKTLLIALVVLLVLLFFSVDLLLLLLYKSHSSVTLLFDVILLTVNSFVLVSIFLDGFWLNFAPTLSSAGEEIVAQHRKALSDANIVEDFKNILNNSEYDPKVSQLLAVYGYETLWLMT